MLSNDALAKLSQLKEAMYSSKDIAIGTVRGTSGRFGFIKLDDGREAFIDPEQMVRVFPGDRVEVSITSNEKGQLAAEFEKFIASSVKALYGRYCIRGKGHFIVAELEQATRWIFLPPKYRANGKDGDYITAEVIRHPYRDGKAQAKVLTILGDKKTVGIERLCTLAKFHIDEQWSPAVVEQTRDICRQPIANRDRADLQQLPFITIDSANTRDIDDALAIEAHRQGWILHTAIADPSSEIDAHSPLGELAKARVSTLYLPGKPLPMLPEELSTDRFALVANACRHALVCRLDIDLNGEVKDYRFIFATVRSRAKLSYQQVTALLANEPFSISGSLSDAGSHKHQLQSLRDCSEALRQYRRKHYLVSSHRPDYHLRLNHQGKLEKIEQVERTPAHGIVEEAMLATNICAGKLLASCKVGIHSCHAGIKEERRQDIETLLQEQLPEGAKIDTTDLAGFCQLIHTLQSEEKYQPLLSIYRRYLQPSELSDQSKPHFGLGVSHYATITSPIRRYQDFYNHTVIRSLLDKQAGAIQPLTDKQSCQLSTSSPPLPADSDQLDQLKMQNNHNRQAVRYLENWLICDYMATKVGQTFTATIDMLSRRGAGVRLADTGIEGFVQAPKPARDAHGRSGGKSGGNPGEAGARPEEAFSFDQRRMELTWNSHCYRLDQVVEVTLTKIDYDRKKLLFTWARAS